MRLYTKHIKVLGMTKDEMASLIEMVKEAEAGHTVNYSERRQKDGSYFGVSISDEHMLMPSAETEYRRKLAREQSR